MVANRQTEAIYVESSTNFTIAACTFTSSNTDFVFTTTSTAYISGTSFAGDPLVSRWGLRFSYSTVSVSNCSFMNFYEDSTDIVGSGIYSLSSDTYVDWCTFNNNTAVNGAGIYFDCSDATKCTYVI